MGGTKQGTGEGDEGGVGKHKEVKKKPSTVVSSGDLILQKKI